MKYVNYTQETNYKAAIIEIKRENFLNALNKAVIFELNQALEIATKSKEIRSIIITGSGEKAFVAGADIKEFQHFKSDQGLELSQFGKQKLFNKIANLHKPVIAAINGYALGGGLELALAAHIRIANQNAKLGLPECSLGLIPGYGGTQRLPQIIGTGMATEMILTGKIIDAEQAHKLGLVNHVVHVEKLMEKALEIAKVLKTKSPEALSATIISINNCFNKEGDDIESKEFAKLFNTNNFKEGVLAFLEKRKPIFD